MTADPFASRIEAVYQRAAGADQSALAFLYLWHGFCHAVDDYVDGDTAHSPETLLALMSLCIDVCSHPFYQRHATVLWPILKHVVNQYADSVAWERADEDWKRTAADTLRHTGNDLVLAVAELCGGWENRRRVSPELRELAWRSQHQPEPIKV